MARPEVAGRPDDTGGGTRLHSNKHFCKTEPDVLNVEVHFSPGRRITEFARGNLKFEKVLHDDFFSQDTRGDESE